MARILIADDSSIMRRNLKTILTQAGHTVVYEAANGEEACRGYELHSPDLVTMDITMPVLNGIDAVKTIVAAHPDANIVMISAFDQRSMLFDAMENGARHYIIKPITGEKLLAVIEQTLSAGTSAATAAGAENGARAREAAGTAAGLAEVPAVGTGSAAAGAAQAGTEVDAAPPPVAIENRDGRFWLRLDERSLSAAGLLAVRTALQGLLFIKPLRVVFDLGGVERLNDQAAAQLRGMFEQIRSAGGELDVTANAAVTGALS